MKPTDSGPFLSTLLFSPFRRCTGTRALVLGLLALLLTGGLASRSHTHFDGVLDLHTGAPAPLWFFLAEGLLNWLSLALVLLLAGRWVSQTTFRSLDLLGTQALARWPMIVSALACLAPGYRRFTSHLLTQLQKSPLEMDLNHPDALGFYLVLSVILAMTIWMVLLMYRGYTFSTQLSGARAIGTFIPALLLAEVLSKLAIVGLARLL